MTDHKVVGRDEWFAASRELLALEKEHTRARDALAERRRALPWLRIDKPYVFRSEAGPVTLDGLFDGRSQLIVYHFMFGPDWQEGCPGCSLVCDHVDGARQHFEHNDLSFVAVSRAPVEKLEAYRRRMGWGFRWVSSGESDFNMDFDVSFPPETRADAVYNFAPRPGITMEELPGATLFLRDDDGAIYRTYSSYARGLEAVLGVYGWLDMAPKGRREGERRMMAWLKRHDRYEDAA